MITRRYNETLLIFCIFFWGVIHLPAYSQLENLIDTYNRHFHQKDYVNALAILDSLIESEPENLFYHREKAKLFAVLERRDKFLDQIILLRNLPRPGAVDALLEVLSHPFVDSDLKMQARRIFWVAKDTEVLLQWPDDDQQTVDCSNLYIIKSKTEEPSVSEPRSSILPVKLPDRKDPKILEGQVRDRDFLFKQIFITTKRSGQVWLKLLNLAKSGKPEALYVVGATYRTGGGRP